MDFDVLEWIKSRRSTRKYQTKDIPVAMIDQIVEAGRYAPSGGNSQSTHFIVLTDRNILDELAKTVKS